MCFSFLILAAPLTNALLSQGAEYPKVEGVMFNTHCQLERIESLGNKLLDMSVVQFLDGVNRDGKAQPRRREHQHSPVS